MRATIFLFLLAVLLLPLQAHSLAFVVDNTLDLQDSDLTDGQCAVPHPDYNVPVCTLRAAIMQLNYEDKINGDTGPHSIILPNGTIAFNSNLFGIDAASGDLDIKTNIVIGIATEGIRPVIDGRHLNRIFDVHDNKSLIISYVDLVHGKKVCTEESPEPVKKKKNHPQQWSGDEDVTPAEEPPCDDRGGAIFMQGGSQLTLNSVHLYDNEAGQGGAIYNKGGKLKLAYGTELKNNHVSKKGGGLFVGNDGQALLERSTFEGNFAGGYGGGVYIQGGELKIVLGTQISGNVASSGKGGGIFAGSSTLEMKDTHVLNNSAAIYGGGIALSDSKASFSAVEIVQNQANSGGGLFIGGETSQFQMVHSSIGENTANFSGGAVFFLQAHGHFAVFQHGTEIYGNVSGNSGGALYIIGSRVKIMNTTLVDNHTIGSGGAVNVASESVYEEHAPGYLYSHVIVRQAEVRNNLSSWSGGGIWVGYGRNQMEVIDCEVTENTSFSNGGGIYNQDMSNLYVTGTELHSNMAYYSGGGIYNQGYAYIGPSSFFSSSIHDNHANWHGGGIFNEDSTVTTLPAVVEISDTFVNGNSAQKNGGGIANVNNGSVNLTRTTLQNNHSDIFGGGIYLSSAYLTTERVSFVENVARQSGGAVAQFMGVMQIFNTTVANNSAMENEGGGILISASSQAQIVNTTVAGNMADSAGGGIHVNGLNPVVSLRNVLIAGNLAPAGDCEGPLLSEGHNLVESPSCSCTAAWQTTDLVAVPAALGAFSPSSVAGRSVYELSSSSPAIDAGDDSFCNNPGSYLELSTDQRDQSRQQMTGPSVCDIGAVEF